MAQVRCPNGHVFEVPPTVIGQRGKCPRCKVTFLAIVDDSSQEPVELELAEPDSSRLLWGAVAGSGAILAIVVCLLIAHSQQANRPPMLTDSSGGSKIVDTVSQNANAAKAAAVASTTPKPTPVVAKPPIPVEKQATPFKAGVTKASPASGNALPDDPPLVAKGVNSLVKDLTKPKDTKSTANGAASAATPTKPPQSMQQRIEEARKRFAERAAARAPRTAPPSDDAKAVSSPVRRNSRRGTIERSLGQFTQTPGLSKPSSEPDNPAVVKLDMPEEYADFAIEPESGDLAALAAEKSEFHLFRASELASGKVKVAVKLRVGAMPSGVCFKQFGAKRYFAVICSQDSHVYLIDAATGALARKISLSQAGGSAVTGSINPDDPFLYYNYGGGHESMAGAVNLRTMQNVGVVFNDAMDCAISASGEVAYRRGPWSPSGFCSLIRINSLAEEKPRFTQLFYDHQSTASYVPDPFDRFTAAGTTVYSRSLDKPEASLGFVPLAFSRKRPVIVGVESAQDAYVNPSRQTVLRAASYNTLAAAGEAVRFSTSQSPGGDLMRGAVSHADFRREGARTRCIVDDERTRVLYAGRRQVALIPLDLFKLPQEPFLYASLDGVGSLSIGEHRVLKLKGVDSKVKVTFDALPDGVQATDDKLEWTPRADQVGSATVSVTLKYADLQRTSTFELNVTSPAVELPFAPQGLAVTPDGKRALIWRGPSINRNHTPLPADGGSEAPELASIDLAASKPVARRKLAEPLVQAVCSEDHLVVLSGVLSPRCDVYRTADLEREKSLVAMSPVLQIEIAVGLLGLQTQSGVEVYDLKTFKRIRLFEDAAGQSRMSPRMPLIATRHGLYVKGVLYDQSLKATLIVDPAPLPVLPGAEKSWRPPFLGKPYPPGNQNNFSSGVNGVTRVATLSFRDRDVQIAVDSLTQAVETGGLGRGPQRTIEIALIASGEIDARQTILKQRLIPNMEQVTPLLALSGQQAFVAFGRQLYRWIPKAEGPSAMQPETLLLEPRQSALTLAGGGKTVLKHAVRGGKPPLKFTLATPYDEIKIDEKTGDVTIDEASLLKEAARAVKQSVASQSQGVPLVDAFRAQKSPMLERAEEILGAKPANLQAAIPISVEVADAESNISRLQYFVLAEAQQAAVLELLAALERERTKARIARENYSNDDRAGRTPVDRAAERNQNDEAAVLKRRLESLEQRLDLITRQLNDLLKKLDKK